MLERKQKFYVKVINGIPQANSTNPFEPFHTLSPDDQPRDDEYPLWTNNYSQDIEHFLYEERFKYIWDAPNSRVIKHFEYIPDSEYFKEKVLYLIDDHEHELRRSKLQERFSNNVNEVEFSELIDEIQKFLSMTTEEKRAATNNDFPFIADIAPDSTRREKINNALTLYNQTKNYILGRRNIRKNAIGRVRQANTISEIETIYGEYKNTL